MKERLRERLLAVATAVGYPIFYVCCLVVFASWTFPFEKVKDRIVASFNDSQRSANASRELAIGDLSSSWLTGLKLTDVRVIDRDAPREAARGEPKVELKIDSIVARLELLPLLIGNHDVDFHVEAFGGKVSGVVKDYAKGQSLDVDLEAIDLAQLTPLTQLLEVPMEGALAGTIKMELPEGKLSKANGSVTIDATDVAVGDGKAKLLGKAAVPRINLGPFNMAADVKDGTMKVSKLGASGKDVDFLADARVTLREQLSDSFADTNMRFRVSDAYRGKNDATKGLFGAPGSSVPGVLDLDPKMKQAKRPDGFYALHARGTLGKLEFSAGGTGGPASGPGSSGGGGGGSAPTLPHAKGSP